MITDNFLKTIEQIKNMEGVVNSQIIKELIKSHKNDLYQMSKWYKGYIQKGLPILSRTFTDTTKINNKIINDFRSEIVDQCVGYLFGKPITYQLNKFSFNEEEYNRNNEYFRNFLIDNNIEDLDMETGKRMGVCGYGARLCYVDKNGKERVMNVNPWEVVFIYDGSIDEIQYAMRYYQITDITIDGRRRTKNKVEWYDSENITYYIQDNNNNYILDTTEGNEGIQKHLFKKVPLIEFPNNDERLNDFCRVESLIDAYDRTISDAQNEIEEFRQAYMVFKGASIKQDTVELARQSGAFSLPSGADASYLTKDINDAFLENHKKNLKDNIYRFSKTIDTNSETFTGAGASGEARKWIMTALEFKAAIKEMKFKKALYKMFDVLSTAWEEKGISIKAKDIIYTFDRNFPQELKLEAEILEKLMGRVSQRTALEIFSPVRDVDLELKRIEEEKNNNGLDNVDLDKEINNEEQK